MGNRIYNVLFHTHTISGIFISALLYVIFFAGSLSFLREEINAWERNEPVRKSLFTNTDFDTMLWNIAKKNQIYGREISIGQGSEGKRLTVFMGPSKDTTIADLPRDRSFFYIDARDFTDRTYKENYSLGEFFYRLHFFAQLNFYGRSGYVLSGLVAFFFLFAVITGLIIHWDKIVQSFYVFRPKQKWKTVWTDAHVSLGLICFPYQFVFAVTGCFLMVGYMFMAPPVSRILFDGDQEKMDAVAFADRPEKTFEMAYSPLQSDFSINVFIDQTAQRWPELFINRLTVHNYGDESMHVMVEGSTTPPDKFLGQGWQLFEMKTGKVVESVEPDAPLSYFQGASKLLQHLHYGDFAGYAGKIVYLLLGFITCFVIISGVLIWLTARDKKNVARKKRVFNQWVANVYLAVCLSMFPAAAFCFSYVKLFAGSTLADRKTFVNEAFFWPWLALIAAFIAFRSNYLTNKACLLLGGILSLLVPISNGIVTGNWPWVSLQKGFSQIFVVDCFWLCLSIISLIAYFKTKMRITT